MEIIDFTGLLDVLLTPFIWILDGSIYVLGYTIYYIVDGFFSVVYTIFSTLDMSKLAFDFVGKISGLPTHLLFLLDAIGLPQCLSIISGAYSIRSLLNLLPSGVTRV